MSDHGIQFGPWKWLHKLLLVTEQNKAINHGIYQNTLVMATSGQLKVKHGAGG